MDPNYPYQMIPPYGLHNNIAMTGNYAWQWNQQVPSLPVVRGNLVHVNPAFLNANAPPAPPNPKRIIINPKFFPHVNPERNVVVNAPVMKEAQAILENRHVKPERVVIPHNVKPSTSSERVLQTAKPSPIRHDPRSKLTKFNFTNSSLKSQYKWRKAESPLKAVPTKHAYKFVRKTSLKSHKLPPLNLLRSGSIKLSPPKLTSTPLETNKRIASRFKLDNRVKNKRKIFKPSSPRASLSKIIQTKYRLIRNKCVKLNAVGNRSIVNRSFSNFKSPVCRPLAHRNRRLQRLIAVVKPTKDKKKIKSPKKKSQAKRYYDDEAKTKPEEETLDDVEIAVKPSGSKERAPIGTLPSFITL